MKEIKYGITFKFKQYYLPTKRHKKQEERELVTCREVSVREASADEFPVALRVTDYGLLPDKEGEYKAGTIDLRWDGESLYEEARKSYGAKVLDLYPVDAMKDILHPIPSNCYPNPEKPFIEGESFVVGDTIKDIEDRMKSVASKYVIYDNKLWIKCAMPYYTILTFGCYGDGCDLIIRWTEDAKIDKDNYLATQRELAINEFHKVAKNHGDMAEAKEIPVRNIEIVIPEAYTLERDLESDKHPGYMWSDRNSAYVKEYGDIREAAHKDVYLINFESSYDRYIARVCVDNKYVFTWKEGVWMALGLVLADLKDISFKDIKKIGNLEMDIDLLKWITDKEVSA